MNQTSTKTLLGSYSPDDKAKYLARKLSELEASNTASCLDMGELLHTQMEFRIPDSELLRHVPEGRSLPKASRRTVYRTAYCTWVLGLNIPIDKLSGINIDKLYHAARLIGRKTPTGALIDHDTALDLASTQSDGQLRKWAAKGGIEGTRAKEAAASDSGVKSLAMQADAVDAVKAFAVRLASVTNSKHPISISAAVLFGLEQLATLPDSSLSYLWREAHGEVTAEEAQQVQTVVLDVEGGEDE